MAEYPNIIQREDVARTPTILPDAADSAELLARCRMLVHSIKPEAAKTVRDFYRKTPGRGPSLIVGIDQGQRRGVTNRLSFLSVLTNIDAEGKLGEAELATDDCIFLPGDVLVVNAVEHELRPFRLLRLGRAHSNARTRPRSQVGTIRCCG
jgi:hypothetical protein